MNVSRDVSRKYANGFADFNALADSRLAYVVRTGESIPWAEMRAYLEARIAGKPARRPIARKPGSRDSDRLC